MNMYIHVFLAYIIIIPMYSANRWCLFTLSTGTWKGSFPRRHAAAANCSCSANDSEIVRERMHAYYRHVHTHVSDFLWIFYIYIYMYTHKIYWYTDIHICTCVIVSTCKAYLKIGVKPNDFVIGWTGVAYFQSMGVSISGGTPKWMVYSGKFH